ncbi:sugar nucleotide-binding protein [Paenibacillus glufosinatiresistens]|uniref:sugar nucleotide-binding protein n=1 Tax=Paenibacillus glufosinatiresistens TaxID=3070657 RepID=UPI00286E50CC|nr:sugar nucleotide-binding protein [Paenibacillus sp. YX.27]
MKLLILGGNGMAGHMLVDYFRSRGRYSVFYTTRDRGDAEGLLLDADDTAAVERAVSLVAPQVILNALGVLNQSAEQRLIDAYHINGFLPHRLRRAADAAGARLIHISTDCVFEGTRGSYTEDDIPDGTSAYAVTKKLGEVREPGHLTIRTSIIGPEIRQGGIGLMGWLLSQRGNVPGYRRVLWNGVTTLELAKAAETMLDSPVSGLIHLAHPHPLSKYELLLAMQAAFGLKEISIVPDDGPVQDRTLAATRPDAVFKLPSYPEMLEELAAWMKNSGRRYA